MRRGIIVGLALGAVGALAGWLHAIPAVGSRLSALASSIPPDALAGSGASILGLLCGSLGVWLGARRVYLEPRQRRTYVMLCVGLLALVVVPHAVLRSLGASAVEGVPSALSALLAALAFGSLVLVGFMSRLYPPRTAVR